MIKNAEKDWVTSEESMRWVTDNTVKRPLPGGGGGGAEVFFLIPALIYKISNVGALIKKSSSNCGKKKSNKIAK